MKLTPYEQWKSWLSTNIGPHEQKNDSTGIPKGESPHILTEIEFTLYSRKKM